MQIEEDGQSRGGDCRNKNWNASVDWISDVAAVVLPARESAGAIKILSCPQPQTTIDLILGGLKIILQSLLVGLRESLYS
jgi:hypothetical protein